MPAATLTRRMSAEDAWFLYFEKPDAPLHIASIAAELTPWTGGCPDDYTPRTRDAHYRDDKIRR